MEQMASALERAKKIRLIAFDVDGVLTDGGIYVGKEGELFKAFFCRDGLGISLARQNGLKTAVITGRESLQVKRRCEELRIDALWQGCMDKRQAYAELKEKFSLKDEEIAYIGDDLIDLPILLQAGLAAAVADALPEVRQNVHLVSGFPGGRGAAREIIEFILKAQGKWEAIVAGFLRPSSFESMEQ